MTSTAGQKAVQSVARRYRRKGYRVIAVGGAAPVPDFLEGIKPDLIAERDDDRVVIEVKANNTLRGSNELREVAERVAREPGWRFELVALGTDEPVLPPRPEQVAQIASAVRQMTDAGRGGLACVLLCSTIEVLLNDLAKQNGLKTEKGSILQVARQLVWEGVMPAEYLDVTMVAEALRNRVVHGYDATTVTISEVERLVSLLGQLSDMVSAAAA
jgi:hypothetical protein